MKMLAEDQIESAFPCQSPTSAILRVVSSIQNSEVQYRSFLTCNTYSLHQKDTTRLRRVVGASRFLFKNEIWDTGPIPGSLRC